jgi:hypothetical protein
MLYHNQFNVDPGVYVYGTITIVVSDIITHRMVDGVEKEMEDPDVVFRVGPLNVEKHIRHTMPLSEFRKKFSKA